VPLLIGGATTSRAHTAVKIEPNYHGTDGVGAGRLAQRGRVHEPAVDDLRAGFIEKVKADAAKTREQHRGKKGQGPHHTIAKAREHGLKTDWTTTCRRCRSSSACRCSPTYPLAEIAEVIDWTPFFQTWELAGRYPKILDDEVVGEAARNLFAMRRRC
jgi:5-methyltetrahydrofolate--homocysteine methyltransferase